MTTPLPPVPKSTPAWLIKTVAVAVAGAGPALAYADPGGHLDTGAVQAAIILGFLVVAGIIFTVQVALAAVHEYGWSRAALDHAEPEITAEVRSLEPELGGYYRTASAVLTPATRVALGADYDTVRDRLDTPPPTVEPPPTVPEPPDIAEPPVTSIGPRTDKVPPTGHPETLMPVTIEAAPAVDGTITSP